MRVSFFQITLAVAASSLHLGAQDLFLGAQQGPEKLAILARLKANDFRDDVSLLKALADTQGKRPGQELRDELRSFAARNAGTGTATTAELWLAVTELRFANNKALTKRNEKVAETKRSLDEIASKNPRTWHAKAAKFGSVACLMAARGLESFEQEATAILGDIASFTNPKEEALRWFFVSLGLDPSEIECEMFASLMIVASSRGDFVKALNYAETLNSRFPEWSAKNAIPQVIEKLRKNESPYSLK